MQWLIGKGPWVVLSGWGQQVLGIEPTTLGKVALEPLNAS